MRLGDPPVLPSYTTAQLTTALAASVGAGGMVWNTTAGSVYVSTGAAWQAVGATTGRGFAFMMGN